MKSFFGGLVGVVLCGLVAFVAISRGATPARPTSGPATAPATAAATRASTNYTLYALWVGNSNPPEYIFSLNNAVAYLDMDALKVGLANLPANATLTWYPTSTVIGNEPLRDADDMKDFKKFCEEHKITLVIVPEK